MNLTPAVGQGTVRIWYLYVVSAEDAPTAMEIAPRFVKEVRSEFLDTRYLNSELNLSDVQSVTTSLTNLGFTAQTAGNVLLGDGGQNFTSDPDLFFNTSNKELGVGTNTPSEKIHIFEDAASPVELIEAQFTTGVPEVRLQAARTANANLANGDDVGLLSFYARRGGSTSEVASIFGEYTGDGTTQSGDIVFETGNSGAPAEALRITAAGNTDVNGTLIVGSSNTTQAGVGTFTDVVSPLITGGVASGDDIVIRSTSHATKGDVTLGQSYKEFGADGSIRIGDISTGAPVATVKVAFATDATDPYLSFQNSTGQRWIMAPESSQLQFNRQANDLVGFALDTSNRFTIGDGGATFMASFKNAGSTSTNISAAVSGDAVISVRNRNATVNNFEGIVFENQSTAWGAGLFCVNETHSATPTSRLEFWTSSGGTKVGRVKVATDGDLELYGATSGFIGFKASATTTSYDLTYPAAQGGSGEGLINNGSGVLSWSALATPQKAGKVDLTDGLLSIAVVFNTPLAAPDALLYTPVCSFRDLVSGDPVYQPYTIIAQDENGFTAEWNDPIIGNNVDLLWSIVTHYDP